MKTKEVLSQNKERGKLNLRDKYDRIDVAHSFNPSIIMIRSLVNKDFEER